MGISNLVYGQVVLGATATQITPDNMKLIAITNHTTNNPIYVGDQDVLATTGFQVAGGSSFYINELTPPGALYAIGNSGDRVGYFGFTYGER